MFVTLASMRRSGWPCWGMCRVPLGWIVAYLFSSVWSDYSIWFKSWNIWSLFMWDLCRASLNAGSICLTTVVEHLTIEQWTASWSIYYCLSRATSLMASLPHQHHRHLSDYMETGLWPLTGSEGGEKKNFRRNIVNTGVLITTVITTKYPHSLPRVASLQRKCRPQHDRVHHRKDVLV